MAGLDPRLERKFQRLEETNQRLQGEINTLRRQHGTQGGNTIQRGIRNMLNMTTLGGRIANKHLYFPTSPKMFPPGFRKGGRLF